MNAVVELDQIVTLMCSECGHQGHQHRPSVVTPFSRGMCNVLTCGCRRYALPPGSRVIGYHPYEPSVGCRYGLVVRRSTARSAIEELTGKPDFLPPTLIDTLPTVDEQVFRIAGHHYQHRPALDRPATGTFFYTSWGGGDVHHVHLIGTSPGVCIGCVCCGNSNHIPETELPGITNALGPLLLWTNQNASGDDWIELVPVPSPASSAADARSGRDDPPPTPDRYVVVLSLRNLLTAETLA